MHLRRLYVALIFALPAASLHAGGRAIQHPGSSIGIASWLFGDLSIDHRPKTRRKEDLPGLTSNLSCNFTGSSTKDTVPIKLLSDMTYLDLGTGDASNAARILLEAGYKASDDLMQNLALEQQERAQADDLQLQKANERAWTKLREQPPDLVAEVAQEPTSVAELPTQTGTARARKRVRRMRQLTIDALFNEQQTGDPSTVTAANEQVKIDTGSKKRKTKIDYAVLASLTNKGSYSIAEMRDILIRSGIEYLYDGRGGIPIDNALEYHASDHRVKEAFLKYLKTSKYLEAKTAYETELKAKKEVGAKAGREPESKFDSGLFRQLVLESRIHPYEQYDAETAKTTTEMKRTILIRAGLTHANYLGGQSVATAELNAHWIDSIFRDKCHYFMSDVFGPRPKQKIDEPAS